MTKAERKAERKRLRSAWLKEDRSPVVLCAGLKIPEEIYDVKESRYLTLLIKGIMVYFLAAGGIGSYLTAIGSGFNHMIFNIVVLITAVICAFLYRSWRSENLGYLLFFVFYAGLLILLRDYVNSGFYAVLNDTIEVASDYFNTEGMTYYGERISDRYLAITIAASIIGVIANILLNNYILRRARYMVAIFITVSANMIAFYLQKEPALVYSIMLLMGIAMSITIKAGGHYRLSRNDHIFKRSKKGISYGLDHRSLRQGLIMVGVYIIVVVMGLSLIYDKQIFDIRQKKNPYKEASRELMQNVIMLGVGGLFNKYQSHGGLATGKLGGVSAIRLDYQTDLIVDFTPYDHNTVYIKNFTGKEYQPYENQWVDTVEYVERGSYLDSEAEALKKNYEASASETAKAKMKIKNADAGVSFLAPYYSEDGKIMGLGEEAEITYYPLLDDDNLIIERSEEEKEKIEKNVKEYLEVPGENVMAVEKLIDRAGLKECKDPMEIAEKLADYYQDNIPYTIRPGATPKQQDFINYFILENQKGYCAHFASAATLVFRQLGIPARYCEGYAISYDQILNSGMMNQESVYNEFYSGYSALGRTAIVSIYVTDADAHAWVEIYVEGKGWEVVEETPASFLEEESDTEDFWSAFRDWFGDGVDVNYTDQNPGANGKDFSFHLSDKILNVLAYTVFVMMSLGLFIMIVIKTLPEIKYKKALRTAENSDKLILIYSHALMKLRKRDKSLGCYVNYKEQLLELNRRAKENNEGLDDEELDSFKKTLEKAGFSDKNLDEAELYESLSYLERLLKNKFKQEKSKIIKEK